MATLTIKGTYSLDPETVRLLEELAGRRGISKSEALRDAIRQAASREAGASNRGIEAFDRLRGLVARDRDALIGWSGRF